MRRWNQTVAAMGLRLDKEQHMKKRALLSLLNIGKHAPENPHEPDHFTHNRGRHKIPGHRSS